MFGNKTQRRPTDSEFLHSESCPTPKAEPGWGHLGGSEWERVCNCRREVWRAPDGPTGPELGGRATELESASARSGL